MIAALYVQRGGCYYGLLNVDPWDEARDARLYAGPWPVVAHPPCARWSRLSGLVEARWGYKRGDDGGCFRAALASVRAFGGVLEHPAFTDAFAHFGLPRPHVGGGWQRGLCGGWSAHVEQWHYGHRAKKATWLYAFGVSSLPSLRWGATPDTETTACVGHDTPTGIAKRRPAVVSDVGGRHRRRERARVSWCGNNTRNGGEERERLSKREASATPLPFRDLLIAMAESVAALEVA